MKYGKLFTSVALITAALFGGNGMMISRNHVQANDQMSIPAQQGGNVFTGFIPQGSRFINGTMGLRSEPMNQRQRRKQWAQNPSSRPKANRR